MVLPDTELPARSGKFRKKRYYLTLRYYAVLVHNKSRSRFALNGFVGKIVTHSSTYCTNPLSRTLEKHYY